MTNELRRAYRRLLARVAVLVGLGVILAAGIATTNQHRDVERERLGCERLDTVRSTVYRILLEAANANLVDAELGDTRAARQEQRETAEAFTMAAQRLVNSVIEQNVETNLGPPTEPTGLPADVHANCKVAYPAPWPFSWFE